MGWIHGMDSAFGNGQDFYDETGRFIGYSVDSVFGG